jgi:hypothetical protein
MREKRARKSANYRKTPQKRTSSAFSLYGLLVHCQKERDDTRQVKMLAHIKFQRQHLAGEAQRSEALKEAWSVVLVSPAGKRNGMRGWLFPFEKERPECRRTSCVCLP